MSLSKTKTVLVSGFDGAGGSSDNPSLRVAKALHGEKIDGYGVVGLKVPSIFGHSFQILREAAIKYRPELIICLGVASERQAVSVERLAVNLRNATKADNVGYQPTDEVIVGNGPAAYFSTLSVRKIFQAIKKQNIAVELSQTAGAYICNDLFFLLMHAVNTDEVFRNVASGYIHIPDPNNKTSPSFNQMIDALEIAIAVSVEELSKPA